MRKPVCCRMDFAGTSRPGVLARLGEIFAERGVSIGEIYARDEGPHGGAVIILRFLATDRMRDFFARRLTRMPDVTEVEMFTDSAGPLWAYLADEDIGCGAASAAAPVSPPSPDTDDGGAA